MSKRFSGRELGLLMAPVLIFGALAGWSSTRPQPRATPAAPLKTGKVQLQFGIEAPTTFQAFEGANVVFAVRVKGLDTKKYWLDDNSRFLQIQTPRGIEVSNGNGSNWGRKLWAFGTHSSEDTLRFPLQTGGVPAGEMHFGISLVAHPNPPIGATTTPLKPLRLSGRWKVERSQIPNRKLTAMPRKPWVKVRSVTLTRVTPGNPKAMLPSSVEGEVIFDLTSGSMNDRTPFETRFDRQYLVRPNQEIYGIGYSSGSQVKDSPRSRFATWMVQSGSLSQKVKVSGRASADNRWPLGFQIEPFPFKTAKVGQKLGFKQFPVALPKP